MSIPTRVLLLIGIAAAAAFTGGQWNHPVAAWVGAVLTLRYYRATARPVVDFFVVAAIVGVAGAVTWHNVVPEVVTAPLPTAVLPLTGAAVGMLAYLVDRWVHRHAGATALTSLVFPTALTALDWVTTSSAHVGTFGSQAYTQVGSPLIQLTSLGGMPLVVFTVAWAASLSVTVLERRTQVAPGVWVGVAIVALACGFGWVRPLMAPEAQSTVRVAGVSLPNSALRDSLSVGVETARFRDIVSETHQVVSSEAERLAADGAELVVFQEGAAFGTAGEVAELRSELADLAGRHDVWLVLPTLVLDADPIVNAVEIIGPDGDTGFVHVKYGGNAFEGSQLGDGRLQFVDTPFGRVSAVVCWDADFPDVVRQAGVQGVDLMVIPANDWFAVRDIHAQMATVRGIENGMAIVRQAGSGVSFTADSYGRQLSRVDSFAPTDAAPGEQAVTLGLVSAPSLFPAVGQVMGPICMVAVLLILGGLVTMWIRRRAPK